MKTFLDDHKNTKFDNIWVTSDMHFRHDNVIKFESIREELRLKENFDGTPDEYLIHKWNEQVGENDLVLNLGDLHWKSYDEIDGKLNGTQLLILGNHDSKPQYYEKFKDLYVVEGIWEVGERVVQYYVDGELAKDKLLSALIYKDKMFSHYPIHNEYDPIYLRNSKIIKRTEYLKKLSDDLKLKHNYCGHLHSTAPDNIDTTNTCIDFNKFKMIKITLEF